MLNAVATGLVRAAEEVQESGEPLLSPYAVGAIALSILLLALVGLLAFGAGREHT